MAGLPNAGAGIDDGTLVYIDNMTKLATRDQDTVTQEYKDQVQGTSNPLQAFINFFFSGIMNGFANLTDLIEQLAQAITGAAGGTVTTISNFMTGLVGNVADTVTNLSNLIFNLANNAASVIGAIPQTLVTGLTGALNGLNSFVQQVVDGIVAALGKIPVVGGSIAHMVEALTGYKSDVKTAQVETKNFVMSSMAVVRQPGFVSDYPLSACTYPGILNSKWIVFTDTVGPATAGTAHSHAIRGGTDGAQAIAPYWGYTSGQSVGGFVTATEDMVFSGFSFSCYSSATPVAGDFFFDVFRENPDGSLVRMISSDMSSFITTSSDTIDNSWITYRLVAGRGEKYLCRIRNASASKTIYVRGLQWSEGTPDIQWETDTAADTNKTSYTAAEHSSLSASSAITGWFVLKADDSDVPEAYTWTDDFERSTLGYFWNQSLADTGGDLVISSGQLAYGGTVNGYQQAVYIRPLATDQFRMDANLLSVAGTGFTSFVCGADREAANSVSLSIGASEVRINTVVNGVASTRASVSRSGNAGKWSLTYNASTKVYTALFNDATFGLSWTDSGSVVPKGYLFRYSHIQVQRLSGVNSGVVDDWLVQDWTP